jgi:hypothetical protein
MNLILLSVRLVARFGIVARFKGYIERKDTISKFALFFWSMESKLLMIQSSNSKKDSSSQDML